MNDGKVRQLLDKFEFMENVPESILRELARAIQEVDMHKENAVHFQRRCSDLYVAFELLLDLHCELREKSGFDANKHDIQYDIFSKTNLLDL